MHESKRFFLELKEILNKERSTIFALKHYISTLAFDGQALVIRSSVQVYPGGQFCSGGIRTFCPKKSDKKS